MSMWRPIRRAKQKPRREQLARDMQLASAVPFPGYPVANAGAYLFDSLRGSGCRSLSPRSHTRLESNALTVLFNSRVLRKKRNPVA